MSTTPDASTRPGRSPGLIFRVALATLPWIAMLVCIPFVNRVHPFILGMPFLLFWIVASVVLTSVCMATIYFTDPQNRRPAQDAEVTP